MNSRNEERYKERFEDFAKLIEEEEYTSFGEWIEDGEVEVLNKFWASEPDIPESFLRRRKQALKQFNVGDTPLIEIDAGEFGLERILVKDESKNHFGTFKDRKALHVAEEVYPYFDRHVLAITSGNYGYSLSRILHAAEVDTILIVPHNLDERVAETLRRKAILVPLDLDARFYSSGALISHAEDKLGLMGSEIIDATNFVISPYDSIFSELDEELVARNEKLDYLLVPLGSGELFLAAVMHYRHPSVRGNIQGKKRIIGVTTDNPNSIAEMIYAKYRPVFYLGEGESLKEQLKWIREQVSRGRNKVEFRVMGANDDEIRTAYEFCQGRGLEVEPSAAISFVPLQRYKKYGSYFSSDDTVVVVNTGDGRRNFQ